MRKLQIIETEYGTAVLLPDELAVRLSLQDQSELDVEIQDKSIVITPKASSEVGNASAD